MTTLSTAPDSNHQTQTCKVTHPFHPLYGQELQIAAIRHNWDEDRVFYHSQDGELASVSIDWTNLYEPEFFAIVAAGRCAFKLSDLLELGRLIGQLNEESNT